MAEICMSDLKRIVKYLDDAADLYGQQTGQRFESRRYYLKKYSNKLKAKLIKYHNDKKSISK